MAVPSCAKDNQEKHHQSGLPELEQYQNSANPAAMLKQARKNTGPKENEKETH